MEIRQRGIHRHVVRFVEDDGVLYALKELPERLARREYTLLRALDRAGHPRGRRDRGRGGPRPGHWTRSWSPGSWPTPPPTGRCSPGPRGGQPTDRLLDALVELLVRLHLSGFFWGDCSLSNTLFRYDAGTLEAYLVDAETSEQHPQLSTGQRDYDLELASERVYGELLDLQAGELLPSDVDPLDIAEQLSSRYAALWEELTREEILRPDEQRYRIAQRLRRLNQLGFDAEEVELISTPAGQPAAGPDPGGRVRRAQPAAVPAGRDRRGREPGPPPAERHRLVPGLAGAEGRPPGARLRGGEPVAGRGVRAGGGGDPGRPARPARPDRDLPRDPGAPVVHVGASRPGRGHPGRGPVLLRPGAARRARAAGRAREHRAAS